MVKTTNIQIYEELYQVECCGGTARRSQTMTVAKKPETSMLMTKILSLDIVIGAELFLGEL